MKGIVSEIDLRKRNGQVMVNKGEKYSFKELDFVDKSEFNNLKIGDYLMFNLGKDINKKIAVECKKTTDELKDYLIKKALVAQSIASEYDEFCDNVLAYAKRLGDFGVTTSMIRRIYSRILSANSVSELKFLRPQFAYTAGKNIDNPVLKEFMEILDTLVKNMEVDNESDLKKFKKFMEAIVAYRKYVGEDNN